MQKRRRTTVIVVGGALAVASVGYGLGTQADDGTAAAGGEQTSDTSSRSGARAAFVRGGQPPGFQELADKLGVNADKLERAFRDFHAREEGNRHDEFATALAKSLGIPADRVTAAFDQVRRRQEARFAARLAGALNVDADKVQAALHTVEGHAPRPPEEFAQALADELNVDVADVRAALFAARADEGPDRGRMHRHFAMPLRQLATALGVSRAELRKAFQELRTGADSGREQHTDALAKFLANRLNLSAADVAKALAELPRPVPPEHRGLPEPGPDGPGHGAGAPGMYPAPTPG